MTYSSSPASSATSSPSFNLASSSSPSARGVSPPSISVSSASSVEASVFSSDSVGSVVAGVSVVAGAVGVSDSFSLFSSSAGVTSSQRDDASSSASFITWVLPSTSEATVGRTSPARNTTAKSVARILFTIRDFIYFLLNSVWNFDSTKKQYFTQSQAKLYQVKVTHESHKKNWPEKSDQFRIFPIKLNCQWSPSAPNHH